MKDITKTRGTKSRRGRQANHVLSPDSHDNDQDDMMMHSQGRNMNLNVQTDSKKISKNEKRLIQNRVSAQRFRVKRKNEFEQLKDDLADSHAQNEQLRQQVVELQQMLKQAQTISAKQDKQLSQMQQNMIQFYCRETVDRGADAKESQGLAQALAQNIGQYKNATNTPAQVDGDQTNPGLLQMLQNQLLSKLGGSSPGMPEKQNSGQDAQYAELLKQLQTKQMSQSNNTQVANQNMDNSSTDFSMKPNPGNSANMQLQSLMSAQASGLQQQQIGSTQGNAADNNGRQLQQNLSQAGRDKKSRNDESSGSNNSKSKPDESNLAKLLTNLIGSRQQPQQSKGMKQDTLEKIQQAQALISQIDQSKNGASNSNAEQILQMALQGIAEDDKGDDQQALVNRLKQQLTQKLGGQNTPSGLMGNDNDYSGLLTPLAAKGAMTPVTNNGQGIGPTTPVQGAQQMDPEQSYRSSLMQISQLQSRLNNIDQSKYGPGMKQQANNKAKMAMPIVLLKDGSPNLQGGVHTPKSQTGQPQAGNANMSTLESLIKQLRNGAAPFSPNSAMNVQKLQERRNSIPNAAGGGPLSSPVLPTSVFAKQQAVNRLQQMVTSQHDPSGSSDPLASMSVSGRNNSISLGQNAAIESSGQNRSQKDRSGVTPGAASNNFSFFNLNAIHQQQMMQNTFNGPTDQIAPENFQFHLGQSDPMAQFQQTPYMAKESEVNPEPEQTRSANDINQA